ncbi:hypothetical protein HKW82_24030 [Pseudomonas aeruginosa]|nr:hypothetical protein [Pseudomonas aeruginosa]
MFSDQKHFVDALPLREPARIRADYLRERERPGFDLRAFVGRNFEESGSVETAPPEAGADLASHISDLWPALTRHYEQVPAHSSLLPLPKPYVVPGGRFREVYYWDSYFTMLGLAESGQHQRVRDMLDNFAYLIDTYGHIPNGNRSYYLSRSQPPFFAYMVDLQARREGDAAYRRYLPQLQKEYAYWMEGSAGLRPNEARLHVVKLADGSLLRIEAYLLPVSYDPFNRGMQEDTLGPWFRPGPRRVDASITISQGGANQFWLEAWNGRFHGSSAGNDGIVYCPADSALPNYVLPLGSVTNPGTAPISLRGSGCNINPPRRWLGYDSASRWRQNLPAQFSKASLPVRQLLAADTWRGIERPPGATSQAAEGFDVTWHTNYDFFPDCANPRTENVPTNGVMNAMPDPSLVLPPNRRICARNGGGGDYLSNESAYRNTVLRDAFRLEIPAGHIHVPVMNNYYTGVPASGGGARNDNAISDARYEAYRSAIVAQTRALLVGVGNALAQGAQAD